ncbi:MAG TPA: hypothetical protein DDY37_05185 [Legionella sp.]|nr:hypothetical protein [Legionella sp.]
MRHQAERVSEKKTKTLIGLDTAMIHEKMDHCLRVMGNYLPKQHCETAARPPVITALPTADAAAYCA